MPLVESRLVRRLLVAAALLAVGAVAWSVSRRAPEAIRARLEQRDIVSTLAVVGRVRAPSRAGLGSSLSGTVRSVPVREGDRVQAGDVLVSLDDREAQALATEAEAALAEVQASSVQSIEEAEREAAQAQRDFERVRAILQEGALTQQRLEQAQQRAADALSRLEALRRAGPSASGTPAAVERAQASLELARARLALTRVTAPAAGTVLARRVEPGDAVSPGRVLVDLAYDGPIELVVFPGEENLASLNLGGDATVSADAFPDDTFDAKVVMIAPSVDPGQGTVEVRLAVPSPPDFLLPDMTVSVNLETGRKLGASVLAEDAVQGLGSTEPWVGVVRQGRLERRPVVVGLRAAGFVEISSGVAAEDSIVRDAGALEIGGRVRVVDPEGS